MAIIDLTNAYVVNKPGEKIDQATDLPYSDAELTEAQKLQARDNIDAISPAEVEQTVSSAVQTALNRSTPVNQGDTNYTALMARAMSLNAEETTPDINGAICWTYE